MSYCEPISVSKLYHMLVNNAALDKLSDSFTGLGDFCRRIFVTRESVRHIRCSRDTSIRADPCDSEYILDDVRSYFRAFYFDMWRDYEIPSTPRFVSCYFSRSNAKDAPTRFSVIVTDSSNRVRVHSYEKPNRDRTIKSRDISIARVASPFLLLSTRKR